MGRSAMTWVIDGSSSSIGLPPPEDAGQPTFPPKLRIRNSNIDREVSRDKKNV